MIITLPVKPLTVNRCWRGQRFKTPMYEAYEKELLYRLPMVKMPPPPYRFHYEFGLSNPLTDFDNPVKPLTDIFQKKYGFNDRDIHEATIKKVRVAKGLEYFTVKVESIT
jgi:hypothetical protein